MVRTISRDELIRMCEEGVNFKLVDVLPRESYDQEHIPGAISLPLDEIAWGAWRVLDKEDNIIVYCGSFECPASTNAANKLAELGYQNVADYKGGLKDYKESGRPLLGSLHGEHSCASCCACA